MLVPGTGHGLENHIIPNLTIGSDMSTGKILESLNNVNQELNAIGKNQKGFGYKFRGIDDVLNAVGPLFKKHSIITTRRNLKVHRTTRNVIDKNGKEKQYVEAFLECTYVFKSLLDGSEITSEGFGEGQDSSGGDKASSMATSNAYKYVIFEMFNISTQEQQDSDQFTAATETKAAKKAPSVRATTTTKSSGFRGRRKENVEDDI